MRYSFETWENKIKGSKESLSDYVDKKKLINWSRDSSKTWT